jgi:hypothetical protein
MCSSLQTANSVAVPQPCRIRAGLYKQPTALQFLYPAEYAQLSTNSQQLCSSSTLQNMCRSLQTANSFAVPRPCRICAGLYKQPTALQFLDPAEYAQLSTNSQQIAVP